MTMVHAPYCREQIDRYEAAGREYSERWPNYCRECGATGSVCYSYDPSPAGVSLSPGSMEECDPCEHCVEQGRCPRCAAPALVEYGGFDDAACSNCGWRYEVSPSAPPPAECVCFDDAEFHGIPEYQPY